MAKINTRTLPRTALPAGPLGALEDQKPVVQQKQRIRFSTISRHPPKLHVPISGSRPPIENDAIVTTAINQVSRLNTNSLAFDLAEFVLRNEGVVASNAPKDANDGFMVLSNMLRMFEHLHILQSSSN